MTWDVILHILAPFGITQAQRSGFERADTLLLLSPDAADRPNTVYVTVAAALPRPFHHALVVSTAQLEGAENRIILSGGDFAEIFNGLAETKNWLDSLSASLALCTGDQEIIDRASLHIGQPMFYLDDSYRILAMTQSLDFPGDEEWVHMREKGYLSPESAQQMKDSGDLDRLAPAREPVLYRSNIFPFHSIICNVWVGGVFVSRLNLLCVDGDTSPRMARACQITAAHLQRVLEREEHLSTRAPLQNMLLDLLHGIHLSDAFIADRLQSAPELQNRLMQLYFADVKARDDRQLAAYYASLLKRLYPQEPFLALVWQEQLVLLAYAENEAGLDPLTVKLAHFFSSHHLRCGVSNPFRDLSALRGFCSQAQAALEAPDSQEGANFYQSLMLDHLLSFIPEEETPFLISPDIARLQNTEGSFSFSLLETLRVYLDCNCNLARTAQRLYLHKNTLLYRLNHIRGILRCDLNDAEERLLLQLSFKLLERTEG